MTEECLCIKCSCGLNYGDRMELPQACFYRALMGKWKCTDTEQELMATSSMQDCRPTISKQNPRGVFVFLWQLELMASCKVCNIPVFHQRQFQLGGLMLEAPLFQYFCSPICVIF